MGGDDFAQDAANDQRFFAPIELEGLTEFEFQWHESGFAGHGFTAVTPLMGKFGDTRVAAGKTLRPYGLA